MNIENVNQAAEAYLADAEGAEKARLEFMKGLWTLQAELEGLSADYTAPDAGAARDALATGQPLFLVSTPDVPADAFRDAIGRVIAYIRESAVLEEAEAKALAGDDVVAAITDSMIATAVRDFDAFVIAVSDALTSDTGRTAPSQATLAFALHSALVPFLTGASTAALESLGTLERALWGSGHCPVCGSAASMGRMSESTKLKGSERTLWCSQCRAEWAYERLRCVRCGSRTQDKLRYTYEEGDPAHRLHLCDTCHGYAKMTFVDEMAKPISMPVEEAVSVTLDAIAHAHGYTVTSTDA